MRILIAPDSFKGTLSALEAAKAMEAGIGAIYPDARCILAPLADGGEGTVDILSFHTGGTMYSSSVHSLDGRIINAPWLDLGKREALVESAMCLGHSLVEGERIPQYYHSLGLGELLLRAVGGGIETVYVALGGTGTHDAGLGMAHALGYRFYDSRRQPVVANAEAQITDLLGSIRYINGPEYDVFRDVQVVAITDVTSPLYGPVGAAFTYAEQKGFSPVEIPFLDATTTHFAEVCLSNVRTVDPYASGMGAAGGLGFALSMFAGAAIAPGIKWIMERIRFDEMLEGADLVVTGEGRLDAQTLNGKTVVEVAGRSALQQIPVVAFAGIIPEKHQLNIKAIRLSDAVEVSQDGMVPSSKEEAARQLMRAVSLYFARRR